MRVGELGGLELGLGKGWSTQPSVGLTLHP